MNNKQYHTPVLLQQATQALNIKPHGTYIDLTFGGAGHSKAILQKLQNTGTLIAFDQDHDTQKIAQQITATNFKFINANFKFITQFLQYHNIQTADGIIADLGISSHQIDTPHRGFAIRHHATLDMRMNQKQHTTATNIINKYSTKQLTHIFKTYGNIKNPHKLATTITTQRKQKPINTTTQLKQIALTLAPKNKEYKYTAKVFQAIRIQINDELQTLKTLLTLTPQILKPKARLVIISYHSLEDTLVKNFINKGSLSPNTNKDIYGNIIRPLTPINTKAIKPTQHEITLNNRARSAKMRIAQKP